ncbi:MAG TPA: hypothetical protein ENH23_00180 [candidate division Zixibacteria bacterium]|nr:hypothetical protein [candidate division Zixibacteria bacterium]
MKKTATPTRSNNTCLKQICQVIPSHLVSKLARKHQAQSRLRLNLQSFLPAFAIVNTAKESDSRKAWEVCAGLKAGKIVLFDKAYVDFAHLHLPQCYSVAGLDCSSDLPVVAISGLSQPLES